ncbi:MAG: hypothetical protein ACLPSF_15480 [Methylocella sp.]
MKSRAVIEFVPLRQVGGETGETGPAQKIFEAGELLLAASHAGLQHVADKSRHAGAGFRRLDAKPFSDILAQADGDVFHDTNIV